MRYAVKLGARQCTWTDLQRLVCFVKAAYRELEENARRLANGEDALCDLSPTGDLAVLAHLAEQNAGVLKSEPPPQNPLALPADVVGLDDWKPGLLDPLQDLSRAVSTLRKLVQWQNEGNGAPDEELNWLVPPFYCISEMGGDSPVISANGKVFGATRAWFASELASRCHEGVKATQKLIERAVAGVKVEEAEKENEELKIKANLNIRKQIREEFNDHDEKLKKQRRSRGRKQGGQRKDDAKALDTMRKQLAALAKKPGCKQLTQKELIEKAIEIVNRNKNRLNCKWESYRPLLPLSRRRSRKKK